jgi:hypothetical protein
MAYLDYKVAGATDQPSPVIWAPFKSLKAKANPGTYIEIFDDFTSGVAADTAPPGWRIVGTNPDLDYVIDVDNGQIDLEGSGADNDESYLVSQTLYTLAMKNQKRFWFEIRCALDDADDDNAIIAGLTEGTAMAADLIADNGASIIDEHFVGFFAATDGTNMGAIKAAVSQGGGMTTDTSLTVLANASITDGAFFKLGMAFDGNKTISFYCDGVYKGTFDVDDLTGNALDKSLGVVFGMKNCKAGTDHLRVDWVYFACEKNISGF